MTTVWFELVLFAVIVISKARSQFSVLKHCVVRSPTPDFMHCMGEQAIQSLRTFEESENFTLTEGLTLLRDERAAVRSIPDVTDLDPSDFRGILENSGLVFGQRSMHFDISRVYPGLSLQIRPVETGGSLLEFVMDPEQELNERRHSTENLSTARILTKKFVVPFLLGLKFNLVTLIPLIFAVIVFLCKKAAFLAKIALFLSGIFGFGGLFSLGALADSHGFYGGSHHSYGGHHSYGTYSPGLGSFADGGGYSSHHHYRNKKNLFFDNTKELSPEATPSSDGFYNYEKNYLLHERQEREGVEGASALTPNIGEETNHRDFMWKTL